MLRFVNSDESCVLRRSLSSSVMGSLEGGVVDVGRTGSNFCDCLWSEMMSVLCRVESGTGVRDRAERG